MARYLQLADTAAWAAHWIEGVAGLKALHFGGSLEQCRPFKSSSTTVTRSPLPPSCHGASSTSFS